jgi:hypothetical protein
MSIIKRDALRLLRRASSTSYIRHVVKSMDDHSGSALNYWLFITYKETVSHAIFQAISLSSPLPKTESKAIGR